MKLSNKFEVLQDLFEDETNIDSQWQNIKDTLTSTCQEVVGYRKFQQKEWISAETLQKIKVRKEKKAAVANSRTRATKAKAQEESTDANREVRKSIKADKLKYIDSLVEEAQDAAGNGNMKQLYDTTRKMSGKYSKPQRLVKDKEGNTIMTKEGQLNRWAEHFEELLNRPPPPNPPDIQPAETDLPISCDIPSREEIRKAVQKLKNGKAAGPDNIPAEALKADLDTTVGLLYPLFRKIWEEEEIPSNWKALSTSSLRKETWATVPTIEGLPYSLCQGMC